MAIGEVLKFGTAYMGDSKIPVPQNPIDIGDIPYYDRANHPDFTVKDTDKDEKYVLSWVQVKTGKSAMYILDRNILSNFSWNDMKNYMNMVDGKTVMIDGKYYTLRSVRCGQTTFEGTTNDYSYNGGTNNSANEWDYYVNNRAGRATLPTPAVGTGDDGNGHTLSQPGSGEENIAGVHNQLWHWHSMYTIGGNQPNTSGYVPGVGYSPAAYWDDVYPDYYGADGGLRPILILKNSPAGSPIIDSPVNNSRVGGAIELLFSPQLDPDAGTLALSVEVSTSADFAADVTKIFTSGIQRKSGSSWVNSTTFDKTNFGVQYRYVISASSITSPDVYIRVGAVDNSGSKEKVYSDPVCVHIGATLEIQGTPPDNKGATLPAKCILYTTAKIAPGAEAHFYVCNNGLDASPTWEETTPGEIHTFANTTKTAGSWALNWKIHVDAGTATGDIKIGPQVALGVV